MDTQTIAHEMGDGDEQGGGRRGLMTSSISCFHDFTVSGPVEHSSFPQKRFSSSYSIFFREIKMITENVTVPQSCVYKPDLPCRPMAAICSSADAQVTDTFQND